MEDINPMVVVVVDVEAVDVNMMNNIEIFGKEIPIRTHQCSLFGNKPDEIESPYINLYIRTKFCNAKCEFCIFADNASKFNEDRYIEVINEVKSKIFIKKIAFTGGEPTLYWDQFKWMVQTASELSPDSTLSMNTDGLNLIKLFEDPINKLISNIHISRHHYNDELNNKIFKTKTPTTEELKWAQSMSDNPYQLQISCNIIKGYIDSNPEVFKMLEWVNSLKINNVGLVALMPVNEYSKENFKYFNIRELINERFNVTREWSNDGVCQCTNYVYFPEDARQPMKVYHKNTFNPSLIRDTLVFDGENLRIGFDGDLIY